MQYIHENNGRTFLLIEVLESGHDFNVLNHMNLLEYDKNKFSTCTSEDDLPPGNWQIIGKGDELKEEQWKEIQDKEEVICNDFTSYTEAGLSILSSLSLSPQTTLILKKI